MPDVDALEKILFNDDDQIKLLISNYNFDFFRDSEPKIQIRAYRYSLFKKDIELADQLSHDFEFDEGISNRLRNDYDNRYDSYIDHLNDKKWMLENGMEESFHQTKRYQLQNLQESYLKSHAVTYKDLLYIFQSAKNG